MLAKMRKSPHPHDLTPVSERKSRVSQKRMFFSKDQMFGLSLEAHLPQHHISSFFIVTFVLFLSPLPLHLPLRLHRRLPTRHDPTEHASL